MRHNKQLGIQRRLGRSGEASQRRWPLTCTLRDGRILRAGHSRQGKAEVSKVCLQGRKGAFCWHPGFVKEEGPGETEKFVEVVCRKTLLPERGGL